MTDGEGKLCDACGKRPATVQLTQVVDDKSTTLHLCEACAAERGLQPDPPSQNLPLADFLSKMSQESPEERAETREEEVCPFCGLTATAFKEGGRLGCPQCYSTFDSSLRSLLRRIHGGTQHVGKVYLPPDPTAGELERRLDALRSKLTRAVDAEDFERAAELRDEIRSLEQAVS